MLDSELFSEQSAETISTIHHALRAPRRRLTILLLIHYYPQLRVGTLDYSDANDPVPVRKIAREIVCIEQEVSADHASGEAYHNVYNSLVQTHLPALDDAGALNFESTRKTISPRENLVALATTAAISSTVAELMFYAALAEPFQGGSRTPELSIDD